MTLLSTRPQASTMSRSFGLLALLCFAFVSLTLLSNLSTGLLSKQSELVKRQVPTTAAYSCGLINGNSETICFPPTNATATLYNNTWYQFSWNIKYPTYAQQADVDIYLYYFDNYQYFQVKSWPNTSNAETGGELAVLTDNSFFAKPLAPGSANATFQYCLYIVGSGVNPLSEIKNPDSKYPTPAFFNFVENALPVSSLSASAINNTSGGVQPTNTGTASSTIATSPSMVSSALSSSGGSGTKLAPWMIAVISAAGVAVVVACIAAIVAVRATKKGKYDKKVYTAEPMIIAPNSKGAPGPSLYDSRDISSIHSTTPIIHGHQRSPTNEGNVSIFSAVTGRGTIRQDSGGNRSNYSPSLSPSNSPQQPHTLVAPTFSASENPPVPTINEPRNSTSILTSNDAMMIADTFRQFMRKPDWQEQELNDLSSPSTPGNDEDEEERRRRVGDELLRKELAEEGTPMQRVQRKATHVNVLDAEKQGPLDGVTEEKN